MKLYEVPRNTKVTLKNAEKGPPASPNFLAGETLLFKHIDGMYSYCQRPDGTIVHLPAWAEVEVAE